MPGGRPKGSLSWAKTPANLAALHLQGLEARWLLLDDTPPHQRNLSAAAMQGLAQLAIAYVMRMNAEAVKRGIASPMQEPSVKAVLIAHRRMGRASAVRELVARFRRENQKTISGSKK